MHTYVLLAAGSVRSHKCSRATPQTLLSGSCHLGPALFGPVRTLYCATRQDARATTNTSTKGDANSGAYVADVAAARLAAYAAAVRPNGDNGSVLKTNVD